MSRIIFQDTYLIVLPSFGNVETHAHPMLHLFVSTKDEKIMIEQQETTGNGIFIDSNVVHTLHADNNCEVFYLFDPTSDIAEKIQEQYIKDNKYQVIASKRYHDYFVNIENKSNAEIITITNQFFDQLFRNEEKAAERICKERKNNERVISIIKRTKNGEFFHKSINDIAAVYYVSESRLLHEFKAQVGISLKNYILMRRLETAYKLVLSGKSITYAAMETNFSSPAHLAATCKKYTGISISGVLGNSSFLKAERGLD